MKKIISFVLILIIVLSLVSCNSTNTNSKDPSDEMRVAMVTDSGDINDQSFNQATYEAIVNYCKKNNIEYKYFKPTNDSDADKIQSIQIALDQGYNVIIMPGFSFGYAIETTVNLLNIPFIGIDLNESNFSKNYKYPINLATIAYEEQTAGFMAGYAAAKFGYKDLGFLGGVSSPAVLRYGYGYLQGIEYVAKMDNISDIEVTYAYANQFYGDADITAAMDTWYAKGTNVVFSCGGGVYTSVCESAEKFHGKVIGVDVDQKDLIDNKYGKGMCITSAIKRIDNSVALCLDKIKSGEYYKNIGGKSFTTGLWSENLDENYVGLAYQSTKFNDKFSLEDYKELNHKLLKKEIVIDNDITKEPKDFCEKISINYLGNLK